MRDYLGLEFAKISATGNDFIVFDNRQSGLSEEDANFFKNICQRRISVGADGVLLIDDDSDSDFALRYFNADGSEAECGNGARAAAYVACQAGITSGECRFRFGHDFYNAWVAGLSVRLELPDARDLDQDVGVLEDNGFREAGSVNTGVPHYVLFTDDVAAADVFSLGRKYRYHRQFQPAGTNVNFVQCNSDGAIRMRTYERGVEGETLSCGTGTIAAALLTHLGTGRAFPMRVQTSGGELTVHRCAQMRFVLEGPVKPVYKARLLSL